MDVQGFSKLLITYLFLSSVLCVCVCVCVRFFNKRFKWSKTLSLFIYNSFHLCRLWSSPWAALSCLSDLLFMDLLTIHFPCFILCWMTSGKHRRQSFKREIKTNFYNIVALKEMVWTIFQCRFFIKSPSSSRYTYSLMNGNMDASIPLRACQTLWRTQKRGLHAEV